MPNLIETLLQRLKGFDEITLLDLLDIDSEQLLIRFQDRVIQRRAYLFGEIEALNEEDALNFIDDEVELEFDIRDHLEVEDYDNE